MQGNSTWRCEALIPGVDCLYAGRRASALAFAQAVADLGLGDAGALGRVAAALPGHFACVCATGAGHAAVVDGVRSYPLFYCPGGGASFTPDPRELTAAGLGGAVDEISLLEMLLAGYVTGGGTVYTGVRQLGPGEVATHPAGGAVRIARYYTFFPRALRADDEAALVRALGEATDAIFARTVAEVAGRPVLVPLSGGLDSRLVLSKLVEHGCPDVRAFSYGPPGNGEAAIARRVADRLGVPWFFLPSTRRAARAAFVSPERRHYWARADGLATVPNMQEFLVFKLLFDAGRLEPGTVVLNGQSGDFTSGGHIPQALMEPGARMDHLLERLIAKHYALWPNLAQGAGFEAVRARIGARVQDLCGEAWPGMPHGAAYAFDAWEWAERQSRYVVNQQRVYDFFGLDWMLPLWDREYLALWRDVPASWMLGQRLYKTWLRTWNYRGLFNDPSLDKPIWRWPGAWRLVVPAARAVGLLGGRRAKDAVYSLLCYFGHYSFQYGSYSYPYFATRALRHRNAASLFAETWVRETLPQHLPRAFR